MTQKQRIAQLEAEIGRLKRALAALVGEPDHVASFELGRRAERAARAAAGDFDGYDTGYSDGLARAPMRSGTVDAGIVAALGRISDRLTGTVPPRRLHLVIAGDNTRTGRPVDGPAATGACRPLSRHLEEGPEACR